MSSKLTVLKFLLTLPRDKVTTYSALAKKFSTHPRAMATYMRTNQDYDTYPCYKVVGKDGSLTGYILGLDEKKKRLTQDGVVITDEGRVVEEQIVREW